MSEVQPQGFQRLSLGRTSVTMAATVNTDTLSEKERTILRQQGREIVRTFVHRCQEVTGNNDHMDSLARQWDAVVVNNKRATITFSPCLSELTDGEKETLLGAARQAERLFKRVHNELREQS